MAETVTSPLTGKALLQKIKDSNLPKRELAKACGYCTKNKSSQTRINLAEFYDAVLTAKGIALNPDTPSYGRGREATYRVSVHKNGSIVIGVNYTEAMGLKPGDEFEIKLGYKHVHLIQLDDNKTEMTNENES